MKIIWTADWHLRGDKPRCRTDENWIEAQRKAVSFVVDYANEHELPIWIGGDIFNTPRVSTQVLYMAGALLGSAKRSPFIMAGNHDLPYHNYDLKEQCSFGVLSQVIPELNDGVDYVNANPFGRDTPDLPLEVACSHQLVFPNAEARPMGCSDLGRTAQEVLEQFPHAKIVLVGDYHHHFVYEEVGTGRKVVNPGCLIRQVADMKDYICGFYVVDIGTCKVERVEIPEDTGLVTDEYLRDAEEKQERMSAFVEAIKTGRTVNLDFRANLEANLQGVSKEVRELIVKLEQNTFNEEK